MAVQPNTEKGQENLASNLQQFVRHRSRTFRLASLQAEKLADRVEFMGRCISTAGAYWDKHADLGLAVQEPTQS